MNHHHHHYASFHAHHRRHQQHIHAGSSLDTGGVNSGNRGRFLGSAIAINSVAITFGIAFMVFAIFMFTRQNEFPVFFLIPFIAIPTVMIVFAIISMVRAVRLYKKILPEGQGETIDEEPDSSDGEAQ